MTLKLLEECARLKLERISLEGERHTLCVPRIIFLRTQIETLCHTVVVTESVIFMTFLILIAILYHKNGKLLLTWSQMDLVFVLVITPLDLIYYKIAYSLRNWE